MSSTTAVLRPAAHWPELVSDRGAIRPPARPGTLRRRHWALLFSFALTVLAPLALAALYLYNRAADQYASNVGFSVRTDESRSTIELLGGVTELSGSSSSDTDILFAYLNSQNLVRKLNEKVDLAAIWSRITSEEDPFFSYNTEGTIEDLLRHWERKVSVVYDTRSGMIEVQVLAFDAQDAQKITNALMVEGSAMINELSALAREDAIKYARLELQDAADRRKRARVSLTEFRNRTQIVDPAIDTQNQMGVLITLQQQLADALIDLDLLRETTHANDPRITQAQLRVGVIEGRIGVERRKLGLGGDENNGDVFATLVGEYESLIVDREFAEQAYVANLASFDAAKAEARKQSRYLAAHIRPTLAEKAEYPARLYLLALLAAGLIFIWSIFSLTFYSLRDRC